MFDLDQYLTRIETIRKEPSLPYLRELTRNHQRYIPFENLDIYYKNKSRLDLDDLFKKIILKKRGGFGIELNSLFYNLLLSIGFSVELVQSSFYYPSSKSFGNPFEQMLVKVDWMGRVFLVDVSTMKPPLPPLELKNEDVSICGSQYVRLTQDQNQIWLIEISIDAVNFETFMKVDVEPVKMIEFLPMYDWHYDDKTSYLHGNRRVDRISSDGLISLNDKYLIISAFGELSRYPVMNDDQFFAYLFQHFGVHQSMVFSQEDNP